MKPFRSRKLVDRLIIALTLVTVLIVVLLFFYIDLYMKLSRGVRISADSQQNSPFVQHNKTDFTRNADRSESTVHNRAIESTSSHENISEAFHDLYNAIEKLEDDFKNKSSLPVSSLSSTFVPIKLIPSPSLGDLLHMNITNATTTLDLFHMQITKDEMYPKNSSVVDKLLIDMATMPIVQVEEKFGGTQFKATITYQNGMRALFKPKRLNRDQLNAPNIGCVSEFERHNSEIAGFHVDRLLGFRRALPVTGRKINIKTEFWGICDSKLNGTFFISEKPDENVCFTGNCEKYCEIDHPICSEGDQLEGSFMAYLPDDQDAMRATHLHPYRRTYTMKRAKWETDPNFCKNVKKDFPMEHRDLLDFIDTAILDFLIGNADRHNYQDFHIFDRSFHMHYDHGRSFGRPYFDDFSILSPVTQCCVIRSSTLKTLLSYQHGPKPLSVALRESLTKDPIAPVLWEPHLAAVDRRIQLILTEIRKCITKNAIKNVIICN